MHVRESGNVTLHAGGEVDVVDLGQGGDRRGGGEGPGLGSGVVALRLDGCIGVECSAAGVDVREEELGEAWCYAAAAAGFFEHFCSFWDGKSALMCLASVGSHWKRSIP